VIKWKPLARPSRGEIGRGIKEKKAEMAHVRTHEGKNPINYRRPKTNNKKKGTTRSENFRNLLTEEALS